MAVWFGLKKLEPLEALINKILELDKDLLNPYASEERRKCKLKRLVQHPNSYFMDVKCPGCLQISTVFSHSTHAVCCKGCYRKLCNTTGGKAKLTVGCKFRKKQI